MKWNEIFEHEAGRAISVYGARYRDTIIPFFVPKLQDIDVAAMWFHQDCQMPYSPSQLWSGPVLVNRITHRDHVI